MKKFLAIMSAVFCLSVQVSFASEPALLAGAGVDNSRGRVGFSLDIFDNGVVDKVPNGGENELVGQLPEKAVEQLKIWVSKVKTSVSLVPKNPNEPKCADAPNATYWAASPITGTMVPVGGRSDCRVMIPSEPTPEAAEISVLIEKFMY